MFYHFIKMNVMSWLACFCVCISTLQAEQKFKDGKTGVSLRAPDGWVEQTPADFGFVILPHADEKSKKLRIHSLTIKAGTPAEAIVTNFEKTNAARIKGGHAAERLLESSPVITDSGIKGHKILLAVGDAPPYLARYYFQKPDQTFFCTCVYFYGDNGFLKLAEDSILKTLMLEQD